VVRDSRAHLREANEHYGEHFAAALKISAILLRASLGCALHALVPGLCTRAATRCLRQIDLIFADRRRSRP
jgi:Family of unknown function (DUF6356)